MEQPAAPTGGSPPACDLQRPGAMPTGAATGRRWSQRVTDTSDALDLEPNVFNLASPRAIAESLKRSAEQSTRRKAEPFRSALSMLVFYINRAGKNLRPERRRTLEKAKDELRAVFGRPHRSQARELEGRPASGRRAEEGRHRKPARRRAEVSARKRGSRPVVQGRAGSGVENT
ncbi:MAG TPA: DUF3175 domain-containing protein [Polyangiaceae bacterium]|nr:DUF3175 domain-containing protein [Polyangiaceae bacterium]